MEEFRKQSAKLARLSRTEAQQVVADTLGSLNVVLTHLVNDVQDLKARNGVIANAATRLAAQEATALIEPLRVQLDRLEAELRALAVRVDGLEARAIGEEPRDV